MFREFADIRYAFRLIFFEVWAAPQRSTLRPAIIPLKGGHDSELHPLIAGNFFSHV
jgi:hypothetical protein